MKNRIDNVFSLDKPNPKEAAPLILAYIGDAVYEVVIRQISASKGNRPVTKLHKETIKYVNAEKQARMAESIICNLTEEEMLIYKRGKNSKPQTSAKNASPADYQKATGFEALIGYLYLSEQTDRMLELINDAIKNTEKV